MNTAGQGPLVEYCATPSETQSAKLIAVFAAHTNETELTISFGN